VIELTTVVQFAEGRVREPEFDPNYLREWAKLADDPTNRDEWDKLWSRFGTHVIDTFILGGKLEMMYATNAERDTSGSQTASSRAAELSTSLEASASVSGSYGAVSGSASGSVSSQESDSASHESGQSNLIGAESTDEKCTIFATGGMVSAKGCQSKVAFAEESSSWAGSLVGASNVLPLSGRPILSLMVEMGVKQDDPAHVAHRAAVLGRHIQTLEADPDKGIEEYIGLLKVASQKLKAWLGKDTPNSFTILNNPPSPPPPSAQCEGDCNRCEGNCNRDEDCAHGLMCYTRDDASLVPGCDGTGITGWDYCTVPKLQLVRSRQPVQGERLEACQGHCNSDDECGAGLKCFHRINSYDPVPGCQGMGGSMQVDSGLYHGHVIHYAIDYCVDSFTIDSSAGKDGQVDGGAKLRMCQGDCDKDSDCEYGLHCFKRDGFSQVPHCEGEGTYDWDYCTATTQMDLNSPRLMPALHSGEDGQVDGGVEALPSPPPPPGHRFELIDSGKCGASTLLSEDDCQNAASKLGKVYKGRSQPEYNFPRGCFEFQQQGTGGGVYWKSTTDGVDSDSHPGYAQAICDATPN